MIKAKATYLEFKTAFNRYHSKKVDESGHDMNMCWIKCAQDAYRIKILVPELPYLMFGHFKTLTIKSLSEDILHVQSVKTKLI